MYFFLELCVLTITFVLYWCHRGRRQHLKQRIGSQALTNIYEVARNVSFMLSKKDLIVRGDTALPHSGCILYSIHFGIWELMPYALRKMGYNLGIIVNKYSGDKSGLITRLLDLFLFNFRSRGGVRIFYKDDTMRIINFVRSGGLLGVLVDGDMFYSKFEKIKKLGRLCHVPVIPFAAYRSGKTGILTIGCSIDAVVETRPLDYLWFYRSRTTNNSIRT
ncbi:MAG: hypothetical protein JSV97_03730 [candidate division WOR-3 bacterium]|nr:MAG: hypothetical protein JSV97_03730 [candidate division WOR-3 bacterium]